MEWGLCEKLPFFLVAYLPENSYFWEIINGKYILCIGYYWRVSVSYY